MATQFKKGDVVRLKTVVPQGAIQKMRMDDDGNVEYFIAWTDADGTPQERWFAENSLQLVEG